MRGIRREHEAVDLFEAQDNSRKYRQRRPLIQLMIVVGLSDGSWQGSFLADVEEFDESDKKSQHETAGHSTSPASEAMYILRTSSLVVSRFETRVHGLTTGMGCSVACEKL